MDKQIADFVRSLTDRPNTRDVYNPYRISLARDNLVQYLRLVAAQPGRPVLLVGEALGYRGGRLTGIPFSSERLLRQAPHPLLRALRERVHVEGEASEATATLVWGALAGRRRLPLFWNAFPFHPHRPDCPDSNRAPTGAEVAEGQAYLRRLVATYRPRLVAGLGKKGYLAAQRALPDARVSPLRHPSYGGKREFERGLASLLRQ